MALMVRLAGTHTVLEQRILAKSELPIICANTLEEADNGTVSPRPTIASRNQHSTACHRTHHPGLSQHKVVRNIYLNSSSSMCNLVFCQDTIGTHHAVRRYPSVSRQLFNTDIRRRIAWELTKKS